MRVFVYYNLHKKCFSVKALEGENKGRVVAHRDFLDLYDVTFKVSEVGRQRVIRERKKNVHAGVVGYWEYDIAVRGTRLYNLQNKQLTYNPYKYDSFVYIDDDVPERVYNAKCAYLVDKQIFI